MPGRRHGIANAGLWADALDGGPFGVIGPDPVEGPKLMGFSGWADDPAAITLVFYVGSNRRRVEIESAKHELLHSRFHERHLAFRLLFNGSAARMRYPVMIERANVRVKALGRSRVFKGCSIGERLAVATDIDNVRVTVWCPDGHPGEGLALARIEGRELDAFIREERKHWGKPSGK